jgi:hypothetical protein
MVEPRLLVNEPGDLAFVVLPDVENEAGAEHAFEEVDPAVVSSVPVVAPEATYVVAAVAVASSVAFAAAVVAVADSLVATEYTAMASAAVDQADQTVVPAGAAGAVAAEVLVFVDVALVGVVVALAFAALAAQALRGSGLW